MDEGPVNWEKKRLYPPAVWYILNKIPFYLLDFIVFLETEQLDTGIHFIGKVYRWEREFLPSYTYVGIYERYGR